MDEQSTFERNKYVRAYQGKKYAQGAGKQAYKNKDRIQEEVRGCGATSGTDFGCGNGLGGLILAECGLKPIYLYDFMGFDYLADEIKANAYPTFTYGQYSLWDPNLPANITDYNLCTDVMEHIPEDQVDAVLDAIALRTRIACFFRIAMFPCSDRKIERHGGPLHVTVKPTEWWVAKLEKRFGELDYYVETKPTNPFKQIVVCTAWKKPR